MCLDLQFKMRVPRMVEGRSEDKLLIFGSTEFEAWSTASWVETEDLIERHRRARRGCLHTHGKLSSATGCFSSSAAHVQAEA